MEALLFCIPTKRKKWGVRFWEIGRFAVQILTLPYQSSSSRPLSRSRPTSNFYCLETVTILWGRLFLVVQFYCHSKEDREGEKKKKMKRAQVGIVFGFHEVSLKTEWIPCLTISAFKMFAFLGGNQKCLRSRSAHFKSTSEWTNERTNEWANELINEWTNKWMND